MLVDQQNQAFNPAVITVLPLFQSVQPRFLPGFPFPDPEQNREYLKDKPFTPCGELTATRHGNKIECEYSDTKASFKIAVANTDKTVEIAPNFSGKVIIEL